MATDGTRISAVLSTRNRGDAASGAVRTILENDYPDFEVIVLDQSDDDLTRKSIAPFLSDPRIRYLRGDERGRSAGLNAAIRLARGVLVSITDDDCTVPLNWLAQWGGNAENARPNCRNSLFHQIPSRIWAG
jgi:glycosyltransferase involved in cell wall biosynthesis